jgi:hypothetical protein
MSSVLPQPTVPRAGNYDQEPSTFTGFSDVFRFFQPRKMKVSKNSPPVLNVDVSEAELVWDRTAKRLYTVSDGALRYIAFT